MSRTKNVFGSKASGFFSVVLVNIALFTVMGCSRQQEHLEMEREARAEAAIAETVNLLGLCHHSKAQLGLYSITLKPSARQCCQQDMVQIPLSLQNLTTLTSESREHSQAMVRIKTLLNRQSQLLQQTLHGIDNYELAMSCSFRPRHLYKRFDLIERELQVELAALNLKEIAAKSHTAYSIADQLFYLMQTFTLIFNSGIGLRLLAAALRPRPLFSPNNLG